MTPDHVQDRIWGIAGIVPPLCFEVVLQDQRSHYLHSVNQKDDETHTGCLRIWDLRAFEDDDIEELKRRLSKLNDREELARETEVHPKLDWANLLLHFDDIAYCIEWHDRLWPEEQESAIGFTE